jgi:nucleoside permease NupC
MAQSLFGLIVFVFIAWVCSEKKRLFPWKLVAKGLTLQDIV